ncbi:hypothetical protein LB504_013132, partial [Fusarium proliferatum]
STLRCLTRRDCFTRYCLAVSCTAETESYHPPTVISRSLCIKQTPKARDRSTPVSSWEGMNICWTHPDRRYGLQKALSVTRERPYG